MLEKIPADEFNNALRKWFRAHGRDLPWRSNPTPYAVLVSEFMLQQTTVAAVLPFFERWMLRFPDVESLAAASEQDVLKHWEGLGYYSRARNLQSAARAILDRFGGSIPQDLALLRSLPGVGPYTAAAVMAFAFDSPVPVLDANIQRVVARLFDFRENIATTSAKTFLNEAAASLLPYKGGRRHASAMMDLGAMVCRSGVPDCASCPVHRFCRAGEPSQIPVKPPKKKITHLEDWRAFSLREGHVFLVLSPGPTWKGLWTLPPAQPVHNPVADLEYSITRYKVRLRIALAAPQPEWQAFPLAKLPPMPSPHRRAIQAALVTEKNDLSCGE